MFIFASKRCTQTWPGNFLLYGSADDAESWDCSGCCEGSAQSEACISPSISPFHLLEAQGTSQKREQKGSTRQRMGKSIVKCLLNMARPLYPWSRGSSGYLSAQNHANHNSGINEGGVQEIPPLTKALLAKDATGLGPNRRSKYITYMYEISSNKNIMSIHTHGPYQKKIYK